MAQLMTVRELAVLTGMSCHTIDSWRTKGRCGPAYVKVNQRLVLYDRRAVEAWMRENTLSGDWKKRLRNQTAQQKRRQAEHMAARVTQLAQTGDPDAIKYASIMGVKPQKYATPSVSPSPTTNPPALPDPPA